MKKFRKILMLGIVISAMSAQLALANQEVQKENDEPSKFKMKFYQIVKPEKFEDLTKVESDKQATFLYSNNQIIKALERLTKLPEEKRTAQDWLLLGNILQDQGKELDAEFMYKRAIMTNEYYFKSYYNLGNLYLNSEKPNLALENYKKAKSLNSEFPYTYYNMGLAYIKLGELKKARHYFIRAIDAKNTEPDFYYNLVYVYKKLGKEKDAKKYLEFYNKLTETSSES